MPTTRTTSVGFPLPDTIVEIRSLDEPTKILPRGEKGEVCLRGPQIMAGYWHNPKETEAVFIDGALRTGDVGYIDGDGYLYLVDRIKDLILCGGFNVYPRVIEEALHQHPAVAEAAVIGISDAYRGQVPKAFVTLRPGAQATPAELLRFLKDLCRAHGDAEGDRDSRLIAEDRGRQGQPQGPGGGRTAKRNRLTCARTRPTLCSRRVSQTGLRRAVGRRAPTSSLC